MNYIYNIQYNNLLFHFRFKDLKELKVPKDPQVNQEFW